MTESDSRATARLRWEAFQQFARTRPTRVHYVAERRLPPGLPPGWPSDPTQWPPTGTARRRQAADGGPPLTAPELHVLYDAWTHLEPPAAWFTVKLAVIELVRHRHLRAVRRDRGKVFGAALISHWFLVPGAVALPADAPLALRDVLAAVQSRYRVRDLHDPFGATSSTDSAATTSLGKAFRHLGAQGFQDRRGDLDDWVRHRIAGGLVTRGLATWTAERRSGLGALRPSVSALTPTPTGQSERQWAQVTAELHPDVFASIAAADPVRAARLVAAAGAAVLLTPALVADVAALARALPDRPRSPGAEAGSSSSHDEGIGTQGLGDLDGLDDLDGLADLSDAWDAVDSGMAGDGDTDSGSSDSDGD